jgi:ATP-dependent RNA circularization protein (DNA/RNA ligase family)
MDEYHKIQSIFKRDEKTHRFIEGEWSTPEIGFLKDCDWEWTEKVDGTNIRVGWDGTAVELGGRTAAAQIPATLVVRLQSLLPASLFAANYADSPLVLYGEGYGAKIQKVGGNYKADGVDFVLFDVQVGGYWLRRPDVEDVATKLGVAVVPVVGHGTIADAITMVKPGIKSRWGDFPAEGLVLRTPDGLLDRRGTRIVTKLKTKDWA